MINIPRCSPPLHTVSNQKLGGGYPRNPGHVGGLGMRLGGLGTRLGGLGTRLGGLGMRLGGLGMRLERPGYEARPQQVQ